MLALKQTTLKANEFISLAVHMCVEAGNIINQVRESGDLQSKLKGPNDPMTVADVKAQTLIGRGFSSYYPSLKVIGEEEEEFKGAIDYDFSKINMELVPAELWPGANMELNIDDCLVFVDPLDATLCFTKNQLDCVQTLIGLTYKSKPLLGVVGQHYKKEKSGTPDEEFIFCPTVFFSIATSPTAFSFEASGFSQKGPGKFAQMSSPKSMKDNQEALRAVTSDTKFDVTLEKKLCEIGVNNIFRVGGAGNKILWIVKGLAEFYYNNKPSMKFWDICAGCALIESLGGKLTDMNGDLYMFQKHENYDAYTCIKGMMISSDAQTHSDLIKRIQS